MVKTDSVLAEIEALAQQVQDAEIDLAATRLARDEAIRSAVENRRHTQTRIAKAAGIAVSRVHKIAATESTSWRSVLLALHYLARNPD